MSNPGLLGDDELPGVEVVNPHRVSPFLLIGDHAGNLIPRRLGDLGLDRAARVRHIAWDIGIAALGVALSERLGATFIRQRYSRLVIDCNRHPAAPDAVPEVSDGTEIPGNRDLGPAQRPARIAEIHEPYQAAIAGELARRDGAGEATTLVSLHSFTPRMAGIVRPWQVGILHAGHNDGFARRVLARLQDDASLTVGDNEPYRMDGTDHTVPRHAFAAGRPYLELEIRQDLLSDEAGVARWADLLADALPAALVEPA